MKAYQQTFKRTEKKYLLSNEQYEAFMAFLDGRTTEDRFSRATILNIYYDTPDYRLIRASLEKPVYKEKLRLRTYGTPGAHTNAFIELKKKYKGVVYKRRIEMPYRDAYRYLNTGVYLLNHDEQADITGNARQIRREIDYFMNCYEGIGPKMAISYDRLALNWIDNEGVRITFDSNIRYREDHLDLRYGSRGTGILDKGDRLMELKFSGGMPVAIAEALSEMEIFPTSFSKYGKAFETRDTGLITAPMNYKDIERSTRIWQQDYSVQ